MVLIDETDMSASCHIDLKMLNQYPNIWAMRVVVLTGGSGSGFAFFAMPAPNALAGKGFDPAANRCDRVAMARPVSTVT